MFFLFLIIRNTILVFTILFLASRDKITITLSSNIGLFNEFFRFFFNQIKNRSNIEKNKNKTLFISFYNMQ